MANLTNPATRWKNQAQKAFREFFTEPLTMYQVSKKTGIDRPNICRFVATWKQAGKIRAVRTDRDPLTGYQAQYLSTNPAHWQQPAANPPSIVRTSRTSASTQLNMFQ